MHSKSKHFRGERTCLTADRPACRSVGSTGGTREDPVLPGAGLRLLMSVPSRSTLASSTACKGAAIGVGLNAVNTGTVLDAQGEPVHKVLLMTGELVGQSAVYSSYFGRSLWPRNRDLCSSGVTVLALPTHILGMPPITTSSIDVSPTTPSKSATCPAH
ncbi:unnamed protein product [Heligmosomoides polygyrus]|uniref:Sulfatase domain-containing protein n=1 Tax=Heligmosomoides polygyrus TaxID=6339 RepID=A0A183G791_HELPZ|nr:unnamed protein product [Heligmosomoides polygyrus]